MAARGHYGVTRAVAPARGLLGPTWIKILTLSCRREAAGLHRLLDFCAVAHQVARAIDRDEPRTEGELDE